ncbi:MAG: flavodoxin family protein [Promethearchaeota archaeon]
MTNKILIIYYSLTGNTKFIADSIVEAIPADILALEPMKPLNPKSGMRYAIGGFQAKMGVKPKLRRHDDINPLDYELLFLGTPVWAWLPAPPFNTFLDRFNLSGKNVALWTVGGGLSPKALERFKSALPEGTKVAGEQRFIEGDIKKDPEKERERAKEWAREVIKVLET